MELALQYEIQKSRPHYDGFMYDIYHQATEQVKLADRLGYHSVWFSDHVVVPVDFEPRYPYDPAGRFPVNHEFPWVEPWTAMSFVVSSDMTTYRWSRAS